VAVNSLAWLPSEDILWRGSPDTLWAQMHCPDIPFADHRDSLFADLAAAHARGTAITISPWRVLTAQP